MNSLDIYQELILDHSRRPRNFGTLPNATHHAEGRNAMCGDEITVDLLLDENDIREARFSGSACAICTASASIMTKQIGGLSADKAAALAQRFRNCVCQEPESSESRLSLELEALAGVRQFPQRVKCALLPWETLALALKENSV